MGAHQLRILFHVVQADIINTVAPAAHPSFPKSWRGRQFTGREIWTDNQFLITHIFDHKITSRDTAVMLYIIGLGLADERDISVKGLEIVRRAARVYLEAYTAILLVDQSQLVSFLPSQQIKVTSQSKSECY